MRKSVRHGMCAHIILTRQSAFIGAIVAEMRVSLDQACQWTEQGKCLEQTVTKRCLQCRAMRKRFGSLPPVPRFSRFHGVASVGSCVDAAVPVSTLDVLSWSSARESLPFASVGSAEAIGYRCELSSLELSQSKNDLVMTVQQCRSGQAWALDLCHNHATEREDSNTYIFNLSLVTLGFPASFHFQNFRSFFYLSAVQIPGQ